jgi:hypothetical protein
MQQRRIRALVICLATTLPMMANAYETSVTMLGMGSSNASGWADGLIPLYFHNQQLIYSDVQIEGASTNAGTVSAGSGYRQQINSNGILGAYLFYDRERSSAENYYHVISPGVEYLTPSWHYRLNYYAPFGTKTYLQQSGWADKLGYEQYLDFSGHDGFDNIAYEYESLSYGGDFNIGYRFQQDNRWELNLTPYVFNRDESNAMLGGNAQLNFYSNDHTTVFLGDGYDNINHNRIFVGISLTFGGHNNDDTVRNLMTSAVYRNLDVNTTSAGLPQSAYTEFSSTKMQEYNNLYFVNNNASDGGDGTYENPYSNVDVAANQSSPDAQIRVASTGEAYLSSGFTLNGTQSMGGYTPDYKTLAPENELPEIQSGIQLPSRQLVTINGDNTLQNLKIVNGFTVMTTGILINSDAHANLDHLIVGTDNVSTGFKVGVQLIAESNAAATSSATISNSTINAVSSTGNTYGVQIGSDTNHAGTSGNVTILNSIINSITSGAHQAVGIGDYYGSGDLTVINSMINVTNSASNGALAYDIFNQSAGEITINNSILNASSTGSDAIVYGIYNDTSSSLGVTFENSEMKLISGNTATAIFNNQDTPMTITDNVFTISAPTYNVFDGSGISDSGNTLNGEPYP